MITLKIYILNCIKEQQRIDPEVCRTLTTGMTKSEFLPEMLNYKFNGAMLDRSFVLTPLLENISDRKWKL
jgi:hypothetical protein